MEVATPSVDFAALVADALPGWRSVDRSAIRVKAPDLVTGGDGQTLKVSAPGADPPVVCLKCVDQELCSMLAARVQIFGDRKLTPRLLAQGDGWFIQEWLEQGESFAIQASGQPTLDGSDTTKFQALGKLVAQIHSMPTEWYNDRRDQLLALHPFLREAPAGSRAWPPVDMRLGSMRADCRKALLSASFATPRSEVARQIVTTHGDLHCGNLLQTDAGMMCIDFEGVSVTFAMRDLAMIIPECCGAASECVFFETYLQTLGQPCGQAEVDELRLDAKIAYLTTYYGPFALENAPYQGSPEAFLALVRRYDELVAKVWMDSELRGEVLQHGIMHCAWRQGVLAPESERPQKCPNCDNLQCNDVNFYYWVSPFCCARCKFSEGQHHGDVCSRVCAHLDPDAACSFAWCSA